MRRLVWIASSAQAVERLLLERMQDTTLGEDHRTDVALAAPPKRPRRGHSLEEIRHDYGIDLILFTYNSIGELEDGNLLLQVKATERTKRVRPAGNPLPGAPVGRSELASERLCRIC